MGSKISVFIIVIAMVILAGLVADTPKMDTDNAAIIEEYKTYKEIEEEKDAPKEFLFEDYLLEGERYEGDIATIDFSTNPLAINFEEIIKTNVESVGVNFAGNYNIVTWSCGPLCQNSAIIDVRNGVIHAYGIISAYGLSFSADSTLLIINPRENMSGNLGGDDAIIETDYYIFIDGELELQGKEFADVGIIEGCIQAITNARNRITNEVVVFEMPCKVPFGWDLIP